MSSIKRNKKWQRRTQFEACEPRMMMTAQATAAPEFQVDYYLGGPTGLSNVVVQETLSTMSVADAYYQTAINQVRTQYGFTGAGQTVVVIDTGMAYGDAALGGGFGSGYRVVGGWDFAEGDADPYDDGPVGSHGTHVAGIIGSSDPNHLGVAPGVDLVSLRVFDDGGAGWFSWVDSALRWVYDHRDSFRNPITTVNLSLGAAWNSASLPDWANLENDFRMLKQVGIFISVAAGNLFQDYGTAGLSYPAASPYVVPVMSSGNTGALSWFSQRLDRAIAAPGEGIVSSVPDYAGNHNGVDDDWASYSGTSMAAAYMSGAAVIVRQALAQAGRTNIDEDMIYQLMRSTADRIFDGATNANYLVLNLKGAVDAALRAPVDREGSTAASAVNLGSLDLRNTVNGSIDVAGDQDFFRFTALHSGKVTISIARAQGLGTRWQLVNANGTLRNVTSTVLTLQVKAGKSYTFGVQGTGGMGEYDLTFQQTPVFTGLGVVRSSRTVNIPRISGEKWYRFQAANAGTMALSGRVVDGVGEVTIELYDAAMQKLSTSNGQCAELLDEAASPMATYFVRLVGNTSRVRLQLGCMGSSQAVSGAKAASVASAAVGGMAGIGSQGPASGVAGQDFHWATFGAGEFDSASAWRSATLTRSGWGGGVEFRHAGGDGGQLDDSRLHSTDGSFAVDVRQSDEALARSVSGRDESSSSDARADDVFAGHECYVDHVFGATSGDVLAAMSE